MSETNEAMEDIWTTRDLPVLKAIVELYEEKGQERMHVADIVKRVHFDESTVQRAIRALYSQPYLTGDGRTAASGNRYLRVGPPTGEARRVVGAWPSPEGLLERLVAGLERAAEDPDRPDEERGKLKQTALFLRGAVAQVAIAALGGAGGNMLS
ncbi:hypothetical protein [Mycobacterium sp. URHB0021]